MYLNWWILTDTEVVSRLMDTKGNKGWIRIDTDLRKLIGVRHLLHIYISGQFLRLSTIGRTIVSLWLRFTRAM